MKPSEAWADLEELVEHGAEEGREHVILRILRHQPRPLGCQLLLFAGLRSALSRHQMRAGEGRGRKELGGGRTRRGRKDGKGEGRGEEGMGEGRGEERRSDEMRQEKGGGQRVEKGKARGMEIGPQEECVSRLSQMPRRSAPRPPQPSCLSLTFPQRVCRPPAAPPRRGQLRFN